MGTGVGHDDLLFVAARCPRYRAQKKTRLSNCEDQNSRWAQPCPRTRGRPIRQQKYSVTRVQAPFGLGGGMKYCLPLMGSESRFSSSAKSCSRFTKSISEVSTTSRSLAV